MIFTLQIMDSSVAILNDMLRCVLVNENNSKAPKASALAE